MPRVMTAELSTCAASARVLSLRGLCVDYGERCVLSGIDLDLADTGTTVLLGPSGTGKSTLLRTVAGMTADIPLAKVKGDVIHGVPGSSHSPPLVRQKASLLVTTVLENLVHGWPERVHRTSGQQQAYVKQWLASLGQERLAEQLHLPVVGLPLPDRRLVSILRGALLDAPLLLIDEPTAALTDRQAEPILALLRQLGQRRSLFVAMHHLGQSRAIADAVVLLASRRIQEHTAGNIFFTQPTSESGRLFLRLGSCPEEPLHHEGSAPHLALTPDLAVPVAQEHPSNEVRQVAATRPRTLGPNGFAWLIPGRLAGTPWPGLVHAAEYDFGLLQGLGVTRLLSLTDRPVEAPFAAAYGMTVANEPIVDMQPPGIDQAVNLCVRIERWLADGDVVAVHCRAGLGRTGTVLGAFWIWQHGGCVAGAQALHDIRRLHPGWVQSASQIEFLHAFATAVARTKTGVPSRSATEKTAVPGV